MQNLWGGYGIERLKKSRGGHGVRYAARPIAIPIWLLTLYIGLYGKFFLQKFII